MAKTSSSLPINGSIPDATTTVKGILKLAGDLGGTANLPTTPTAIHITGNEVKDGNLTLNDTLYLPNLSALPGEFINLGVDEFGAVINIPIETSTAGDIKIAVTNKTGVSIPKGSAVYINGAQGSKATVALALADPNIITSASIGITSQSIANNATGYVVIIGEIFNIDTSSFANGDKVYLSPTTPGGLTTIIPTSPNNVVFIGTVTNSHATQGKIIINVIYTSKLDRLVDVHIDTPLNNNVLTYEESTGLWKNESIISALGYTPENIVNKGVSNGYTPLDGNNKVPLIHINDALLGNVNYQGLWNQVTNTPNLDVVAPKGHYYVSSGLVLTTRYGIEFGTGDWIISNGTTWDKVDNTDAVTTVFGRTGNILAVNGDYNTALIPDTLDKRYQTDNQKLFNDATSSIQAQLNSKTPLIRTLNINGVTQDLSVNREWRVAQGDTGVLTFAGLTTNSATTINIGAAIGVIVDNETNPLIPITTSINYPGATNVTVTTIAGTESFVMLGTGNVISFQNSFPTAIERKTKIWLGKVAHPAGAVTIVVNEPDIITSPLSLVRSLYQKFSYINEGVYPYINGANLNFNTTGGKIGGNGINFVASRQDAHDLTVNPVVVTPFLYKTRTGGISGAVTVIDPTRYDVAGTPTLIGGGANNSTIQYIYLIPGQGLIVQYGQTIYSSLTDAIIAIGKESPVIYPNLVKNSILIGVLAVNRLATQLNNPAQGQFFKADMFGQIIGATAGTTVGTLQTAYNNSPIPQIQVTDALGAVTIKNSRALNTSTVQEWQNIAGVTKGSVDGNGFITSGTTTLNDNIPTQNNHLVRKDYLDSKLPVNYTKTVYVNATNPNAATIFDLNNPPTTNDNLLKSDVNNLYIGTDISTWVYNGSLYVTKTIPSTPSVFYNAGTTVPASNTTAPVERSGSFSGRFKITDNPVGSSPNFIRQDSGTDYYKIFAESNVVEQMKMVFEVGDNGVPIASGGQSFEFRYSAASFGTPKTVFTIDYNDITALANITSTSFIKSGATITDALLAGGGTLANPVSGTSSSGRVSFWSGTSTQGGDADFVWDNANKRLGVGVASPGEKITVANGNIFINSANGFGLRLNDGFEINRQSGRAQFNYSGFTDVLTFGSSSGNVGVNMTPTSVATDKLQVNGNITATSYSGGATLTGTPTAPTASVGTSTTQIATTAFVQANARPYKVYTALLTQSGTSAPVATILENTLGTTINWSYNAVGSYQATAAVTTFTANKTALFVSPTVVDSMVNFLNINTTQTQIITKNVFTGTPVAGNGQLSVTSVEIRVYP